MTSSFSPAQTAVRELFGADALSRVKNGCNSEVYLTVSPPEFAAAVSYLAAHKFVLSGLFCVEAFSSDSTNSLFSVFIRKDSILILVREVNDRAQSIATVFPSASWFERECHDGFGVVFDGAFDTRRLFLHETYPDGFHPLKKSTPNEPVMVNESAGIVKEYPFRTISGDGVYQVAVGPVHPGIIEPGHFRFSVIGETVFGLEIRMFYTHRGIEKCAEGKLPADCVAVAEAISGDESVANATGFCMAAERISQIAVPDRAWFLRTILCELERICSHLGDQAGMLTDVAFPLGASQFSVLRERLFREDARLTSSRFMRGMVCVGGVTRNIENSSLQELHRFIKDFRKQYKVGLKIVLSTPSVIDRFTTTGVIQKALLRPLNITGPIARASGGRVDVRIYHPYGTYDRFCPDVKPLRDGDVLARFTMKASEVTNSLDMIEKMIAAIPDGEVCSTAPVRDGYAISLVESPRGENLCWLLIKNGVVDRYKVRTASFCNWMAIEHAAPGNIIADFPVINKSLNLSYAGTDL